MDTINKRTYDAIVIGSGISGGWAAKEFCDRGLKTLMLERGRDIKHIADYPTTMTQPWEFPHRGKLSPEVIAENPVLSKCYAFYEGSEHFFVKDKEHPYKQEKPFDWIRGYQVGGKGLMWARQTQRWSQYDFDGPARDGFAVEWPINYDDLAPWYSYVEKFAGIAGNRDGLPNLPDGEFLPGHELNCIEDHFGKAIKQKYNDSRHVIIGRCAHLTQPKQIHYDQGRAQCQNRTICERGCPYGGYFSSNASTIPWAMKTGKLTMRTDSVVHSIIFDDIKQKAVGVRVIDAHTNEMVEYYAKVIFVNAAAFNTNLILLNSISTRFENGLGNDSGLLGKYVAFHNYRARISGVYDGYHDKITEGKRPTGAYMPRFRNVYKQETDFLRGYAAGIYGSRIIKHDSSDLGVTLKESLAKNKYEGWSLDSHIMGETIPKEASSVSLDKNNLDSHGIPQLKISIDYDNNDLKMTKDYFEQMTEMFESAGIQNIKTEDSKQAPGLDIHEMGGVRMGNNPKTSILNKWNQMHACKNVFVTDGACMTSTSTQNPSLTYMAFTARAVEYAASEMRKKNI